MEATSSGKHSYIENSATEVGNEMDELRVLAIDAQIFSLQYLCAVLQKCNFKVKTALSAAEGLEILKANKDEFDIVLVDVDSSTMDGFKLLGIIGLEIYSPVIMVTSDDSLDNITKGLIHGAVDYILKPVGVQEIKTIISQTVTQNKTNNAQNLKPLVSHSHTSFTSIESDHEASCSAKNKKRRLLWTRELDDKFMNAVQQLISNGSRVHPKSILKLMNEPGLTRANVASHLQKHRISLKKREAERKEEGFYAKRFEGSSSYGRISNQKKWDVNSDSNVRIQGSSSFNDINSSVLNPIMPMLSPCQNSTNSFQSLLCTNLDDPNHPVQDFKSFDHHCLASNIQHHGLGSAYFHDSYSDSAGSGHGIIATAPIETGTPLQQSSSGSGSGPVIIATAPIVTGTPFQQFTSAVGSDVQNLYPGVTRKNIEINLVSNAGMNSHNDQIEMEHNQQEVDISEWLVDA